MSHEGVEQLRWLYGQWAKGNLWALRDVADPDMEWEWSEGLASLSGGPRVYRGLEEIGEATRVAGRLGLLLDDRRGVHHGRRQGRRADRARPGGEHRPRAGWTLRDGRAIRARYYDEPSQAFEAVGLRE